MSGKWSCRVISSCSSWTSCVHKCRFQSWLLLHRDPCWISCSPFASSGYRRVVGHAVRVPLVAADAHGLRAVREQRGCPAVRSRGALCNRADHRQRDPEKGNSSRTSLLSWLLYHCRAAVLGAVTSSAFGLITAWAQAGHPASLNICTRVWRTLCWDEFMICQHYLLNVFKYGNYTLNFSLDSKWCWQT